MYDSKKDTTDHIEKVNHYISMFCSEMIKHAENHDKSKLEDFEKPYFDKFTPRLSKSKYGTQEYMDMLNDMKIALDHHYEKNSHHPQHYEYGVDDMTLFDIVEMFFDWKSSSERHDDGDIYISIETNKKRFNMSHQLTNIFTNTAKYLKWDK